MLLPQVWTNDAKKSDADGQSNGVLFALGDMLLLGFIITPILRAKCDCQQKKLLIMGSLMVATD